MKRLTLSRQDERAFHEYVAEIDPHVSQARGIVGRLHRMCTAHTMAQVRDIAGPDVLEVGCGEGLMFDGADTRPIQIDVALKRLQRVKTPRARLLCADAYELPFKDESFQVVLAIAVLEHTREPSSILKEIHRVLRPGGRAVILIPNDITLSLGRLMLLKFPARYPDHLTFITPTRLRRWLRDCFAVVDAYPLPFRALGFWCNLYYFVVAQKIS